MYSKYIQKALEMAIANSPANEIMRCFSESSYEELGIDTIKYFRVNAENKIELVSAYGEIFAMLENFKYISRDRKLPISDVINTGSELFITSPEQLVAMYDEAKYWRELPSALAIIPVTKHEITVGCLSITLSRPIETSELKGATETLQAFAHLLELLLLHELSGIPTLLGLNAWTNSVQTGMETDEGKNQSAKAVSRTNILRVSADIELTERQYQIAVLIASGATNSDIAKKLGYSAATIRYETVKLYERLRVKNRSQASSRIREMGIA
jgi:hypothetical protein